MFLLRPDRAIFLKPKVYDLHSNMFLLRRGSVRRGNYDVVFTFQYVSIKTRYRRIDTSHIRNLHSNMFLLRPETAGIEKTVYINLHSNMFLLRRRLVYDRQSHKENLHSNMFLLRQKSS